MSRPSPGGNITLAAVRALLSYVPFKLVAKMTLLLCVFLFIADPFPPLSRLISIITTLMVAMLSRWHRAYSQMEEQEAVVIKKKQT
jgi:hypothetical protein